MAASKRSVSSLPEELIQEVFIRLPKKSILRFRCISKRICNLIDSPVFKKCYDIYHNSVSDFVVMLFEANRRLYSMDFNLLDNNNLNSAQEKQISIPLDEPVVFIGSCKGMVCFTSAWAPERYVLLNPFNGTFEILEHSSNHIRYSVESVALGYDSATDDYKIVRWESDVNSNLQYIDVYSLRSDSWGRVIREFNPGFSDDLFGHYNGVCVEGVVHWLWQNFNGDSCIAAFDLETEELRSLKVPPWFEEEKGYLSLLDFGGRLYVNVESPGFWSSIVWVMEEYGVESSWTPLFNIVDEIELIGFFPTWDDTRLLCFESDSILWSWLNTQDDGSVKNIQIRKLPRYNVPYTEPPPQSWVCVRSPVRLRCSQVQKD